MDNENERPGIDPLTRRQLLAGGARAGGILAAGGLLGTYGGAAIAEAAGVPPSVAQLRKILNLPSGKAAGQGLKIPLGGDYALSGVGAAYGVPQYQGALEGVKWVKKLGGPAFDFKVLDTPGETLAASGVANARQFGSDGIPIVLTSQGGGGGGASIPIWAQFQIFAMDAGGATDTSQSKPFLYQGCANLPSGMLPTIIKYNQVKRPQAKRWSILNYAGALPFGAFTTIITQALTAAGYEVAPAVIVPIGTTNWSGAFSQLQAQKPDMIFSQITLGTDAGVMMKQYVTSGLSVPVVGLDYTLQEARVAGPGFTNYEFAFDYFNAIKPTNPWAKAFTHNWIADHGGTKAGPAGLPGKYNANYYEAAFTLWELVRRIIKKGGDPMKQGTAYVDAFTSDPTFPSLFGPGKETGTDTWNPSTHGVEHRTIAYGRGGTTPGRPTILATADTTGTKFKLLS